jgi:hypothetical protein
MLAWLAGLSLSVKFTSGLFVAGLGLAAIYLARPVVGWRMAGLAAVVAAVPAAGWMAESWLFLGNPFNPFLSGIFPALAWGPGFSAALGKWTLAISPSDTFTARDWLRGLWRVFGEPGMGSAALFASLPLLFVPVSRTRARTAVFLVMASSYLIWLPSYRNSRYLFAMIPLLAALIGDGSAMQGYVRGWRGWRSALAAYSLAASLGLAASLSFPHGWLYLTGQVTRGEFMAARFTSWDSVRRWVNEYVPPGGRVVFSGEEQRLWLARRVTSFGPVYEPMAWRYSVESRNPAEIARKFRQAGVTHLVHNFISGSYRSMSRYGGVAWTARERAIYAEFIRRYMRPVRGADHIDYTNGGFMVYEFIRRPSPRPFPLFFLPFTEGKFRGVEERRVKRVFDGALREWESATLGARDELSAWVERGRIFLFQGRWAETAACLKAGVEAGLVTDLNLDDYGTCLVNTGRLDEGVRWMSEARRVFPDQGAMGRLGISFFGRGRSLYNRGEYVKAARDAEQSVYLWPGDAKPRILLAAALVRLGRGREAVRYAREGAAMAPGNRDALDTLKAAEALASRKRGD